MKFVMILLLISSSSFAATQSNRNCKSINEREWTNSLMKVPFFEGKRELPQLPDLVEFDEFNVRMVNLLRRSV